MHWSDSPDADDTARIVALTRTNPAAAMHALRTRVTDLGIAAEDALKVSMEALIAPALPAGLPKPDELDGWLLTRYERVHALSLILSQASKVAGDVGCILSLETEAGHFRAIGESALACLRVTITMGSRGECRLPQSSRGGEEWRGYVADVVTAMRGVVLVCATAERQRAQAVRSQALDARAQIAAMREGLVTSGAGMPESTVTAHQRLVVATTWCDILDHIAAICSENSGILAT